MKKTSADGYCGYIKQMVGEIYGVKLEQLSTYTFDGKITYSNPKKIIPTILQILLLND